MMMQGGGAAWPAWTTWHLTSAVAAVAVVGVATLWATWSRLGPRRRTLVTGGFAAAALLLSSDVQTLSMTSYRCHMIEHLVVILVIAPLFAAAVDRPVSRPFATAGFLAFTVLVPLYHLTPLGGWVMQYSGGHLLELSSFLVVGVWFWAPVYGHRRVMGDRQRITYMVLALPVIATTGLVLWSSTTASLHSTGMDMAMVTVVDIHDGGLLMMTWGSALMLGHIALNVAVAVLRRHVGRQPVALKYS